MELFFEYFPSRRGSKYFEKKTVQLPNAFMCKAVRLIGNTIRYSQTLLSFRQTHGRERIS